MMREFAKRFAWVWGMTGRPMPQAPTDVWAQCKILTPQHGAAVFPARAQHADDRRSASTSGFPSRTRSTPRCPGCSRRCGSALDDVVELPEAISRTIDVENTEEQLRVYRKLANEFAVMIENKQITAANAGVAMGKLLQVGAGYVYSTNPSFVDARLRRRASRCCSSWSRKHRTK